MINLKMSRQEAKQETAIEGEGSGPAYPYGLSLQLDDEVLAKLGITTLPAPGQKMALHALVEVTNTSQYENQDGKDNSISLQITDMDLQLDDGKSPAQRLYSNSGMNP